MKFPGLQLDFRPLDDLGLKAIALLLALGLWSLVPDSSLPHQVRGVPVQLVNLPSELALAEPFDTTLELQLRGNAQGIRDLVAGELSPRVNLFGKPAGESVITIAPGDIPTPLGVSVERIEPTQIRVVLEEKVRALLPVNAVVEGNPAEGYEIGDTAVDPAVVTVAGPRSRVEALGGLSTEAVRVTGLRASLNRTVPIFSDDPLVTIEGASQGMLRIEINEIPVTLQLEEIAVEIVNASYRVVINPATVGIVLRGAPSDLDGLSAEDFRVTIDVSGLSPRAEDYRMAPAVRFLHPDLVDRVEILALTPQRRLDVHVYDQPAAGR